MLFPVRPVGATVIAQRFSHPTQAQARDLHGYSLGNFAVTGVDQLAAIVPNRPQRIQYRPDLLISVLAHTGLTLAPEPQ